MPESGSVWVAAAAAAAAAAKLGAYLGVPMKLVVNQAAFGNAGDLLEGALVPVGRGRHNCCLADLANHKHLRVTHSVTGLMF